MVRVNLVFNMVILTLGQCQGQFRQNLSWKMSRYRERLHQNTEEKPFSILPMEKLNEGLVCILPKDSNSSAHDIVWLARRRRRSFVRKDEEKWRETVVVPEISVQNVMFFCAPKYEREMKRLVLTYGMRRMKFEYETHGRKQYRKYNYGRRLTLGV